VSNEKQKSALLQIQENDEECKIRILLNPSSSLSSHE